VYSHNLAVKQDDEFGITYTYTYQYNADDKPVYQAASDLIITYDIINPTSNLQQR
jgi:hypothetical protein